jgi:membrane protein
MADAGQADGGSAAASAGAEERARRRSRARTLRVAGDAALGRIQKGAPGTCWSQLSAVDFMNSSLSFAALAVVCGFPFLAVIHALVGEDVRQAIITRGLNAQAARDVNALIASGHQAVSTLTVVWAVLLVVGAVGMASTIQAWYQRIYDQGRVKGATQTRGLPARRGGGLQRSHRRRGLDTPRGQARRRQCGSVFILTFVFAVLFWWCSAYFLL